MQLIDIHKVKENPENPRFITEEKFKKLKQSIQEFPEMLKLRPIVVNSEMFALGGNMRLKACKDLGIKEVWIVKAEKLTQKQQREFIVKDNVGFGQWDWDTLANEWNSVQLEDWGLDAWQNMDDIETSDAFSLPDGEKEPFQQQTYTLADKQVQVIKEAIKEIKKTEEFNYVETFGNENSNGNALYLLVSQWVEQRK